jgi:hypothetical protein
VFLRGGNKLAVRLDARKIKEEMQQ